MQRQSCCTFWGTMEENVENVGFIHIKLQKHCLILTIIVLVLVSANFWANNFVNHQAIFYKLPPSPQSYMLFYESSLCSSPNIPLKPPPHNNIRCPQKPIVTVKMLGRLGNQMYEYISVWAIAKTTGREPYVPSCMIRELGEIFRNLPVPALSYRAYSPIKKYPVSVTRRRCTIPMRASCYRNMLSCPYNLHIYLVKFDRYFSSRNI